MIRRNAKKEVVSIIIPALNEEKTIAQVIKDIRKLSNRYLFEIIVIDDGSTDKTAIVAKKAGASKVISHKKNQGKGAAFRTGMKNATGEYVVQMDADNQLFASDLPKLILPLQNGSDVVLGSRYSMKTLFLPNSTSFANIAGNVILSGTASVLTGRKIIDIMTGFKAFKRKALINIRPTVNHFGYETELVINAAKKKYKIHNVLIRSRKREVGKSNLKIFRHGILVFQTILNSALKQ